jgi:hypothetical protein
MSVGRGAKSGEKEEGQEGWKEKGSKEKGGDRDTAIHRGRRIRL